MSLPFSDRPGTDMCSKQVCMDQRVINVLTNKLVKGEHYYTVAPSEWKNKTRSDLVLVDSFEISPPIIIEFQNMVTNTFMKRVINYGLECFKQYKKDPIILIFAIRHISPDVAQDLKQSKLPGCYSYRCRPWAENCFIFSSRIAVDLKLTTDEFLITGRFLTKQSQCQTSNNQYYKHLFDLAQKFAGDQIEKENTLETHLENVLESQAAFLNELEKYKLKGEIGDLIAEARKIYKENRKLVPTEEEEGEDEEEKERKEEAEKEEAMEFIIQYQEKYLETHATHDWVGCKNNGEHLNYIKQRTARALRSAYKRYQ